MNAEIDEVIANVEGELEDLFTEADAQPKPSAELKRIRHLRTILTALQNEKARQGAEAVAWMKVETWVTPDSPNGPAEYDQNVEFYLNEELADKTGFIPLYAHPPAAIINNAETILTHLRRDVRNQVIEECATIASMFTINKNDIHHHVKWDDMNEDARSIAYMASQYIAEAIRALAERK